jgi:hypothetical protein
MPLGTWDPKGVAPKLKPPLDGDGVGVVAVVVLAVGEGEEKGDTAADPNSLEPNTGGGGGEEEAAEAAAA